MRFPGATGKPVVAVEYLNLTIKAGESLGIVGESGSGKSVTALSAMQLLPASAICSGQILWKGEKLISSMSETELSGFRGRQAGMIFQEPLSSLNPLMRCGDQVAETLQRHLGHSKKEALALAKSWFERVKLRQPDRILQSFPHQLSGGQRQRVMIAMALCTEPELLIADEPTTALDVTIQRTILELIKEFQQELGIAVLFISHDLGVMRAIADRVVVMQNGVKVEEAAVGHIFKQAVHPYTKGLVACRPNRDKQQKRLPTIPDFLKLEAAEIPAFLKALELSEDEMNERRLTLNAAETVLQAKDLNVLYSGEINWIGKTTSFVKAVQEVSFDLKQGERLGIVGESGSGKTTLGKAILKLLPSSSGKIVYRGQDITGLPEKTFRSLRPRLQMIFQDPFSSLNPKFTIRAILMEALVDVPDEKEKEERLLEVLKQVGLEEAMLSRFPKAFSGGQRQRIGIARALLLNPDILICDESVSALDVSVQAQVLNLIKDLQERYQFSLIFISHDLGVIKFIADRVLVMQAGRLVEQGPTNELFDEPKELYTKELLGALL